MKLSISSYSFQQYIKAGKMTQLDTVKKAHDLGFSAIEFIDLQPIYGQRATLDEQRAYAVRLREEAEKYGMTINAYTIGANLFRRGEAAAAEIERLCGQVEVAALLGATVMRHDVCYKLDAGDPDGRCFDDMLPVMAENIRAVADYAASRGIRTCSENHGHIAQDSLRVEKLFHTVHHLNYGLLVDVGNFACVDEDSATAVSRVANCAVHAHVKDFIKHPFGDGFTGGFVTRGCNRLEACAVGDGDIPVAQCLAILERAGYDGFVSVEYEGAGDCLEGIKKSRDFLLRLPQFKAVC